jgi:hypothetical protein
MFWIPYDLSLFAYNGVQGILCFVFALFSFVLYALCCHFIWIVLFFIRYSLPFICTLYPHCYRTNYRIVLKNKKQKNQLHSVNFWTAIKWSTFEQELTFVKNQLCQIVVFGYCSNSVDNKSFDQKSAILIVKTDF